MASGGHFAALEQPEALAMDIRAFFRSFRVWGVRGVRPAQQGKL